MPERNCSECTKHELWGCTAKRWRDHPPNEPDRPDNWVRPAAQPVHIMGETSYACPRQHVKEHPEYWSKLLKFYGFYKKGFLPEKGGFMDQANAVIELFRILDDANDRCDQAELERQRSQKARGKGAPTAARKK